MRSARLLATATLLALGGCSLAGRVHVGDVWLGAGHRLSLLGNHVRLAIH